MTPHQIVVVQESFAKILPIAETASEMFYARLFETAPHLRPLFPSDMSDQSRRLMLTLVIIINGLPQLSEMRPAVAALAKRHAEHGIEPAHYKPFGEAFLWMLEKGLGGGWTSELRDAWAAAYATISDVMITTGHGDPQPKMGSP